MIEVTLTAHGGKTELGKIRIENVGCNCPHPKVAGCDHDDKLGNYSIQFAVERCGAVGLHRRSIHNFPRTEFNVLALLMQALNTLDEKELRLEDETTASDMARRLDRALPPFPSQEDD